MSSKLQDYDALRRDFRWTIPPGYNIAVDVCDRWAAREPARPAILEDRPEGVAVTTFGELRARSNQLAHVLRAAGVRRGDRVAILLPQSSPTILAHLAIYKLGAVALPLAALFGADALAYRLADAGAAAIVTNAAGVAKLRTIETPLPDLAAVLSSDGADGAAIDLPAAMARAPEDFTCVDTHADDPALLIYTSGTTGPPKGALHGHRVLLGHLPGFQFAHEVFPQPGDRIWTVSDWAWAGGLLNAVLPALHFGVAVVARRFDKFDPDAAFDLMARMGVRNAVVPPTALRMLRAVAAPRSRYGFDLRTLMSAGETLGAETYAWAREALGVTVNEAYGQTECNLVLGSCAAIGVTRAGAIGRVTPGHDVAILRPDGSRSAAGELGEIAIRRPDPVMFLGYWRRDEDTRRKFRGDWMTTGDQARMDADGYVVFAGRDDDVITSAGYRIGPTEIEDCLLRHPAVAMAAVVGKKDAMRTEIVKAFVTLRPGFEASDALAKAIQVFVRNRLSAHEYPREIAFLAELPLTTTGKVIRRKLRDLVSGV